MDSLLCAILCMCLCGSHTIEADFIGNCQAQIVILHCPILEAHPAARKTLMTATYLAVIAMLSVPAGSLKAIAARGHFELDHLDLQSYILDV